MPGTQVSQSCLEARDIYKRFAGQEIAAVNGVSLDIKQGEFYSLLGPSGCGKTTLLRIMAGLESPDRGEIRIEGRDVTASPPFKRPVNMVFQSYALFPHLSVLDNVAFGLRHRKMHNNARLSRADMAAMAKDALERVRMGGFADRLPVQLSGGQQQRVALARALVLKPAALLLDEPLSALDVQIRDEMQEELKRINRDSGIAFVMVTHDQAEALAMSEQIAVFNSGNIEQLGSPAEIYARPRTEFVARFIGNSNVVAGIINGAVCDTAFGAVPIDLSIATTTGPTCTLCFKPEAVRLRGDGTAGGLEDDADSALLSGIVSSCNYQGSSVEIKMVPKSAPDGEANQTEITAVLPIGRGLVPTDLMRPVGTPVQVVVARRDILMLGAK
jgi:spermidine/putrescine transport system ATP-binding protein